MLGIILSINRFVRVFAYGLISHYVALIGLRKMCFLAAILATFSTAIYGYSTGFFLIFLARIIWGIAYAILVLITLAYAIEFKERTGTRVGVSQTLQRFGPIFSLIIGSWMVTMVGPKTVFLLMTIPTAFGIFIALYLPKHSLTFKTSFKHKHNLSKPTSLDLLFFIQGYGIDGVFSVTITLMIYEYTSLSYAVIGGGILLALRHFSDALGAPLFGTIADQFGIRKIFLVATLSIMCGFFLISFEFIILGSIVLITFKGALVSLGPTIIAKASNHSNKTMSDLARMQTWRDLGAAIGPLVTGTTLVYLSAGSQHFVLGIAFMIVFLNLRKANLYK